MIKTLFPAYFTHSYEREVQLRVQNAARQKMEAEVALIEAEHAAKLQSAKLAYYGKLAQTLAKEKDRAQS